MVLLMMLTAGTVLARSFDTGYEPVGLDDLVKRKGLFRTTLVSPNADFSRYTRLYQHTVKLIIRDPGPVDQGPQTGTNLAPRGRGGVMPGWAEIAQLKEILDEAIAAELERSAGVEVVHDSGPKTLVLRAAITDIVCDETTRIKTEDGEPVLVVSQGKIVFDLIDGETGVILARFGERRRCERKRGSGETANAWPFVDAWVEAAAADLCRELERLGAAPPAA
jgi:hypothetical protein